MPHPARTRFGDIVVEFMPPRTSGRRHPRRGGAQARARVIIYCPGVPSAPPRASFLKFFSDKGFWIFALRYRGSWESGGTFLKFSPEKDVLDIVNGLTRDFKDLATRKTIRLRSPEIFLFGASFGGPAAILASHDPRVAKAVAASPVVDWNAPSKEEPFGWMVHFVEEAFGGAYRGSRSGWRKLKGGKFYSPVREAASVSGEKLLIFQARDDRTVGYRPVKKFATKTSAGFVLSKRGGHFGSSFFMKPPVWKKIKTFLRTAPGDRRVPMASTRKKK